MPTKFEQAGEQKLKAVIEAAIDVIITINQRGIIVSINKAVLNTFGYTPKELIGKNISTLMPAPFKTEHDSYLENYHKHGKKRIVGIGREAVGQKKDGSVFPIRLSVSEFTLGDEIYFTGIIYDLTEIKNIQSDLKASNATLENLVKDRTDELSRAINKLLETNNRLKTEIAERKHFENKLKIRESEIKLALTKERELNDLKSRFVSMASHEFRTPLSVILSSVGLLGRYITTDEQPKRDRHLARIKQAINTLTGILEDFLFYSKAEDGQLDMKEVLFCWDEFVKKIEKEANVLLKSGQRIIQSHRQKKIPLFFDEGMLSHGIFNLISNAVKYSKENQTIYFNSWISGDEFVIEIKDEGIGIPDEDQIYLFTRFFRAKNVQNIKGTGLGLSIVQNYIERMGGKVTFKSEYQVGSTFCIRIPVKFNSKKEYWEVKINQKL